jgi:hypothetical protein
MLPVLALWRRERRLVVPVLGGAIVFLAAPFLILGPGVVLDYVQLVTLRGSGDLTNDTYGTALLSWSGFFVSLTGESQPVAWLLACLATIVLFAAVWWRAEATLGLVAAVLAALLVVPHSHFQDWILMAPVAAILLDHRWKPLHFRGVAAGLFAIFFGLVVWPGVFLWFDIEGPLPLVVTLSAFGLLLWLAGVTYVKEVALWLPRRPDRGHAVIALPQSDDSAA